MGKSSALRGASYQKPVLITFSAFDKLTFSFAISALHDHFYPPLMQGSETGSCAYPRSSPRMPFLRRMSMPLIVRPRPCISVLASEVVERLPCSLRLGIYLFSQGLVVLEQLAHAKGAMLSLAILREPPRKWEIGTLQTHSRFSP